MLAGVDPDRRCPTCPDWTASDLLWHLTEVHLFWGGILERRVVDPADLRAVEESKPARPSSMEDLVALRTQATSALVEQLALRDDAEPCWSWWSPEQTVGFTRRMQTYEATMHRVDSELTAGVTVGVLGPDVAAGSVDHAVDVMWGWMPDAAHYSADAVVEFVATDVDARWLVEVGRWSAPGHEYGTAGSRAVRARDGNPTVTVRGTVEDLALWSWGRGGSVHTSGDPLSLAALDAVVSQGMP